MFIQVGSNIQKKNVSLDQRGMLNPYDGALMDDDDDLFLAPLQAVSTAPTAAVTVIDLPVPSLMPEESPESPPRHSLKRKMSSPIDELIPKKTKYEEPLEDFGDIPPLYPSIGKDSDELPDSDSQTSSFAPLPLPDFGPVVPISSENVDKEKTQKEPKKPKEPKEPKKPKEPKPPKRKEPVLPKAENKRDRPINRCVLTYDQLPSSLKEFLEPKILMKPAHIFAKDEKKGPYQGITPFVSHGTQTGWGAQLQNKQRMQMIRIGTFDDIKVAAIAFTAAYVDNDLIDEPLKARDWLEDMCKDANKEALQDWIILQSIC